MANSSYIVLDAQSGLNKEIRLIDNGDSTYSIAVSERPATTPTQSSVAAATSTTTLLAANTARRGATVYNDSDADLYLKLGSAASTTSFTIKLSPGEYYEIPFGYTGAINGIWSSATGNARITELT